MAGTQTRSALIYQALRNLGVLAEGQTPTAETMQTVDAAVNPTIAELNALGIVYVPDVGSVGPTGGEIEDALFLPIAHFLADNCKAAFGLAEDPALYVLRNQAEVTLRRIGRPARARRLLKVDSALRGTYQSVYVPGSFTRGT